jgi:cytochrome c-type biogenesis protein CcmH/NrfG
MPTSSAASCRRRRKAVEAAEKEPKAAAQSILDANPKGGKIDTLTQGFELTIPLYRTAETKTKRPFQVTDQNMTDYSQSDGRIWRARRQGQGEPEGLLHQRLSAEERLVKHRTDKSTGRRNDSSDAASSAIW